jgi:O-antigen ligase
MINIRPITRPIVIKKDVIISIFLALYILSTYFITTPVTKVLGSILLYTFLGLTFFKLVTKQTPLKITSYIPWYLAFGIVGAISFFYALDSEDVLNSLYTYVVSFVLTFSFIQYTRDHSKLLRIISFYAYLPIFLIVYLFVSGDITSFSGRLGEITFGNANDLAMIMMITLCCIFWLTIYGKKKYLVLNIALSGIIFYIIALTGGRKFILIPFIFLFFLLLFKTFREKKISSLVYLLLIGIIVIVGVWAVINIPVLFNSIGVRFEGLINFFSGTSADTSTIYRYMMIREGWNWFLDKPILGYGLNNFRVRFSQILADATYAHNNYIELLFDLGLVGAILYYAYYAFLIIKLTRINNDHSGMRDFFLSFMLVLIAYEMGGVTYNSTQIQLFIGLASAFLFLDRRALPGLKA